MTDTTVPTWIAEGAEVAVYNSGRGRPEDATIRTVTIKSVNKVHIVATDGSKYRTRNLESTAGRRSSWDSAEVLRPLHDPAVQDVLHRQRTREAIAPLSLAVDKHKLYGNDPERLLAAATAIRDAAIAAVEALTES